MLSDVLAVVDESAEKILSGNWAMLAAKSHVPPAPRYLYTVQAVSSDGEEVWLHSHGLNRCGLNELEILNSEKETAQNHYAIIETMANRLLEHEEPLEMGEPLYLARLAQDVPLIVTLLPWQVAVKFYDDTLLGGTSDRQDSHNEDTCCIFVYPSEEDFKEGHVAPVSIYDALLVHNPMYMISTKETMRMKALALERVNYMKATFQLGQSKVLVKLGLDVDPENSEYTNDGKEHIWFELQEISGTTLKAELTQDPYYIKNIHKGDIGQYTLDDLTDWILFTPDRRITPDDVYILPSLG